MPNLINRNAPAGVAIRTRATFPPPDNSTSKDAGSWRRTPTTWHTGRGGRRVGGGSEGPTAEGVSH